MPWIAAAAAIGGSMLSASSQRKAQLSQESGIKQASMINRAAADQASLQAMQLHDAAQQNSLAGFQGGLDVFGQTIPAQLQAFQSGNLNAQNTTRAGLDPQIAAILGGNIDLSGLQAQRAPMPSFSMFQQQLPEFQQLNETLNLKPNFEVDRPVFDFFGIAERMRNLQQNQQQQQRNQQQQTGMSNPTQNIPLLGGNF